MNVKQLTLFSLFVVTVLGVDLIISIPFMDDEVISLVVAIFLPFIGLRNYGYFLIYAGLKYATIYTMLYSFAYTMMESAFIPLATPLKITLPSFVINNLGLTAHGMTVLAWLLVWIIQPAMFFRILWQIGFYKKVMKAVGI